MTFEKIGYRLVRNAFRRMGINGNLKLAFLAVTSFGMLAFFGLPRLTSRNAHVSTEAKRCPHRVLSSHVICPKFSGGIGNNLFQFAGAYGIARHVGLEVVLHASNPVYQNFEVEVRVDTNTAVCAKAKALKERLGCCTFDSSLMEIRPTADYSLGMYTQSWKYFHQYQAELRRHLRFRGDIEARAREEIVNRMHVLRKRMADHKLPAPEVLVGMHVRRGNYLEKDKVTFGYKVADAEYIAHAQDYFRSNFRGTVGFFVFSNDLTWCRANVNGSDVEFIPGGPPEQDLAALSLLNHTIMTVGTYGWWGAWLAGGLTVYFKDFVEPGSRYAKECPADTSQFFPPKWVGL